MIARLLLGMIRLYQISLSRVLPNSCRFEPTCSAYMAAAIRRFGAFRGAWLGLRRLARCTPWGGSGWDPVPERVSRETLS